MVLVLWEKISMMYYVVCVVKLMHIEDYNFVLRSKNNPVSMQNV